MSTQLIGLALSYLFVFGILSLAGVLLRLKIVDAFDSRKLVHVGVAHWWFIAVHFFEHPFVAIIGPLSFIVLNYISYKRRLFRAMEDPEHRKNLGTVYFPIALLLLVIWSWCGNLTRLQGGIAILALGYGDGLAAVLGRRFGRRSFQAPGGLKTYLGCGVMFVAVAAVAYLLPMVFPESPASAIHPATTAIMIAMVAVTAEICTPWGMDNISIPCATALVAYMVM